MINNEYSTFKVGICVGCIFSAFIVFEDGVTDFNYLKGSVIIFIHELVGVVNPMEDSILKEQIKIECVLSIDDLLKSSKRLSTDEKDDLYSHFFAAFKESFEKDRLLKNKENAEQTRKSFGSLLN